MLKAGKGDGCIFKGSDADKERIKMKPWTWFFWFSAEFTGYMVFG